MFDFCKQTKKIANEWYIHTWSKLMMESEGKFSMVQSWSYLCDIFQSILLDWTWIFFCWQLEIKIYGKHISWGLHVHVFEELIAKLKYHIFHCILYVFIDRYLIKIIWIDIPWFVKYWYKYILQNKWNYCGRK